jgi:DNA-binding NarL/FixJ family response regulator
MIVLIIENSIPMRRVIRGFVGDFSRDICESGDTGEAMRSYCLSAPPDWVLLNLEIKNTDGIADIALIKKRWRLAKVIALTVFEELELREAASAAGAYACVLKEDLSQIRRIVGR